jgi:hypothetical protein
MLKIKVKRTILIAATIVLIVVASTFVFPASDHDKILVEVCAKDYITGEKMDKVAIQLLKNGKPEAMYVTDTSGKIEPLEVSIDNHYRFVFSKKGYVTRSFAIDVKNVPDENQYENGWDVPVEMNMILKNKLKKCRDDIKFIEKYDVSTLRYDSTSQEVGFSSDTAIIMRNLIDACVKK